jgi:membrane protein
MMSPRKLFRVLKQAATAWSDDRAPTMGAALAYYTAFSLAPLLLLAISMASLVLGEDIARGGTAAQIRQTLGPDTGAAVAGLLDNAYRTGGQAGITLAGLATLLLGASGVFLQLQESLNVIWKTQAPARQGSVIVHFLRYRLLSFTAVLCTGFLLLVSLVVSALLAALSQELESTWVLGNPTLWRAVSSLVSLGMITLLFALIFKLLPDQAVAWRDVWGGAALTAVLFTMGQYLIGLYLGQSGVASAFGAAGSLVVLLVWVYYSAQILLFGAEVTYAHATLFGSQSGRQNA